MSRFPLLATLALSAAAAFPAGAARPVVPVLPVADVRPGQAAVVRTVFAGDSIETFDAEIVGVLPGGRAGGDVILARATSPRVVASGIPQGMSGSPVYVDGKLVGALSSGWAFSKEPLFGITPIAEMLDVLDAPESARPDGTAGPAGVDALPGSPRFREFSWSDGVETPAPPAPDAFPRDLGLPLAAGGIHPGALPLARELFASGGFTLTPGGRASGPGAGRPLEPGSAVAVDVLRGDLNFSAIGTLTYVDGDRMLLFGHPFFQGGEVRMPISRARIVGVMPSLATSFKLGIPGEPVGVATQDRRAAVAGRLGGAPALMPFRVEVRAGGRTQSFAFECIEDRTLLPQLVGTAALNSVLESGGNGAQQSLAWSLTAWSGGRVLRVGDLAAGDAPLAEVLSEVSAPIRFLAANPYERCRFDSLLVTVDVAPGREQWTVRGARTGAAMARPGSALRVKVELERWRGGRRVAEIDVLVPEEFPDGRYTLWLGGGTELDRATAARLPARFRPVSLADAWQRLGAAHRSDRLYTALWARAPEVSSDGLDYPELPHSALAVLASPENAGEGARRASWALVEGPGREWPGVVRGEVALDIVVDRSAP